MRRAAEEQQRAQAFNAFLEEMADKYEHDEHRLPFWQQLLKGGVTVIGREEDAVEFLRRHTKTRQVREAFEAVVVMLKKMHMG
jgi:hypothetical protein